DKQSRQDYRQQVHQYCSEQLKSGDDITITELSHQLPAVNEQSFAGFTEQKGYEFEESFPADRTTLRQLTKFSGRGGGLTLN
ncbi:nucleoid-associated protein, partial [Rosenbergiella nectarea]|uniref:nucleoid-associated protein n=1 Tax=Rosenbergiella nectarea TaxID=988801 RepID=UPI001F500334